MPPPQVRPPIEMSSNMTCQDELTKCYEDVIRLNNLIDDTKDYKKLVKNYCKFCFSTQINCILVLSRCLTSSKLSRE